MRLLITTIGCLTMTAMSALALDQTFVEKTMQSAQNIERDAMAVHVALKNKKADAADVKTKIEAMSGDITAMQKLVAEFEAGNPQMNERDRADWKLVKDKVQLIEIFHGHKQQLAAEDLARNRNLIRAHAKGVAERAGKLQQTLSRLMRTPIS